MSKAKFAAAKELIDQKKYHEARTILRTIDHPVARQWLRNLDELTPHKDRGNRILYILISVVSLILVGSVGALLATSIQAQQRADQEASATQVIVQQITSTYNAVVAAETQAVWDRAATHRSQMATSAVLPPTLPAPPTEIIPTQPFGCWANDWWRSAGLQVTRFLDIAETAAQTARIALGALVLELRQAQRDFEAMNSPDCVRTIRSHIVNGMDYAVAGFNNFLGEAEVMSFVNLDIATQHFHNAYQSLIGQNLTPDYRLFDTALLIWGGTSPAKITPTYGALA